MTASAIACIITWGITLLSWALVSTPDTSSLNESFEVTFWLAGYFLINAIADYTAYKIIGYHRVRWGTGPLRVVLLLSVLLHVAGGFGYALDLDYEPAYVAGLWVVAIAQLACFIGPRAHNRLCSYQRKRRSVSRSVGACAVDSSWIFGAQGVEK